MVFGGISCSRVLSGALEKSRQAFPQVTSVRYWRERPDNYVRRYGYKVEWYINGPLPRVKPSPEEEAAKLKPQKVKNPWNAKRALFGQNDYIDILGDGTVHPRDLLTGPTWLRGFRGNEFQRLIRKQYAVQHYLPDCRPTSWNNLQKRIRYLWKWHNLHQHHKDRRTGLYR